MRKVVCMTVLCFALMLAGCAESGDTAEKKLTTAARADAAAAVQEVIPPRETFAEIPEGAEEAFDHIISIIDKTYPKPEGNVKRYFGYTGEETVEGSRCYVFAVYDSVDEPGSKVVTAAVSDDCGKVFGFDDDSGSYRLIEN